MAVKVVDPNPQSEVVKEIVCRHCGVKLSYVPNDMHESRGRDYSGGPAGRAWIICASCGKDVTIRAW